MAVTEKWAVADDWRTPVGEVAATTLRRRFDAVWNELHAACIKPDNAEHVHQLRVATRRTLAAIDAFRDLIPGSRRAWFEKRLRRLRRAAGEARDLDVLTDRLAHDAAARARNRLLAMLGRQRERSRMPIREQFERLADADWLARVDHLLADIHGRKRQTAFRDHARRRFKPMVASFFEMADHKLDDGDAIHSLRIETKKLRYAMEIFAPALPTKARDRCRDSLERLQATLGEFTDHAAAAVRFKRWAKSRGAGPNRDLLLSLRADEDRRADLARKAFCRWWNPARRRALRRQLHRTLRRHSA